MRARIASLEGSGRRADAQLKSVRKYVKMLETTLAKERKKVKGETGSSELSVGNENRPIKSKDVGRRESHALCEHCLAAFIDKLTCHSTG